MQISQYASILWFYKSSAISDFFLGAGQEHRNHYVSNKFQIYLKPIYIGVLTSNLGGTR
jgi:hypothetical protein